MKIDHIHFYVRNAVQTRDWLIQTLGFQSWGQQLNEHTHTEIVGCNQVLFLISSGLKDESPVKQYLSAHPEGVIDIAFLVDDLDLFSDKIERLGIPIVAKQAGIGQDTQQMIVRGWGDYQHTLVTTTSHPQSSSIGSEDRPITNIDHVVLNVGKNQLNAAANWYQNLFDFQVQQVFDIQTEYSGLYSQALVDASGQVQFNINEPSTPTSQIQTFLDIHNGAGIQHIGLRTSNIIQAVAAMRDRGLSFLPIPNSYYAQLFDRLQENYHPSLGDREWPDIKKLEILLDWPTADCSSLLMQIFTLPIFEQPTFFLEIIERRDRARGFGAGNFLALFQSMEKELQQAQ